MDKYFYITLAISFFIHLLYYIKFKRKKFFVTSIFILAGFTLYYFLRRNHFNPNNMDSIVIAMTVWSFANIAFDIIKCKNEK